MELLEDPTLTELLPGEVEVLKRSFANRLEAGKFFNELLDTAAVHLTERDKGLWTWLTLFYFDEVCPADGHGRRNPEDEAYTDRTEFARISGDHQGSDDSGGRL